MVTSMYPPYRGGGVSSHVYDLVTGLARQGHEVWVLSNRKGKPVRPDESRYAAGGARIVFCNTLAQMFTRFTQIVPRTRFDLIHFHSFNTLAVAWVARAEGSPSVFTMHSDTANHFASLRGWSPSHPGHGLLRLYEHFAIRFPEITIAVSRRIERQARELGARRVTYVPNAVDCGYWIPTGSDAIRKPSILVPRMLVPKNGVEVAIRAMHGILAAVPNAQMIVPGDGPLRESLEQLANQVAKGRVRFLGEVPRGGMRKLYHEASIVMIPSIVSSGVEEATSIAALEAMACGLPVVASNIGGLPEIIHSGENGILVPDRDPEALCAATLNLLLHPDLARQIGKAARETILRDFCVPRWTERVRETYAQAVELRSGSGSGT